MFCVVQTLDDRTMIVAEQVRANLKPFFKSGLIDKEAYKQIMRKAVPKVFLVQHSRCHVFLLYSFTYIYSDC